jgi:hypothetical protein
MRCDSRFDDHVLAALLRLIARQDFTNRQTSRPGHFDERKPPGRKVPENIPVQTDHGRTTRSPCGVNDARIRSSNAGFDVRGKRTHVDPPELGGA